MPCIIRKVVADHDENYLELAPDEWTLAPQVEALETWLRDHADELDPSYEWIATLVFHRVPMPSVAAR